MKKKVVEYIRSMGNFNKVQSMHAYTRGSMCVSYLTHLVTIILWLMQFTVQTGKINKRTKFGLYAITHGQSGASANFSIYIAIMTPCLQYFVSLLLLLLFFEEMLIEWM